MLKQLSGVAMLALAACATVTTSATVAPLAALKPSNEVTKETLLALNEICGAEAPRSQSAGALKLKPGVGASGFKVDTSVKEAQDWFNYGLALSDAFYHDDAKEAMRNAVKVDPACSLCQWGLAWVLGPTLNYPAMGGDLANATTAAARAKELAKPGDDKARRLAEAMVARYANQKSDTGTFRMLSQAPGAEQAFGAELTKIAADYPNDIELAVLASHSLLIPVPRGDRRGLKPALAILENVLKIQPDNTGAIHYYIHATELDHRPEDAIPYAERLAKLAPAASHLVHMPAHAFFWAGRYEDAAVANAKAIGADIDWLRTGSRTGDLPGYYAHNLAFGLAGALMAGDGQLALKYADHAARVYPDTMPALMRAGIVPRTWVALARYAPDRALGIPAVSGDTRFKIYRAYARGEAMLQKGDVRGAQGEAASLAASGVSISEQTIARNVLEGRIAMAKGDPGRAAKLFDAAAHAQEASISGMDPPMWWYPVRRSVAAAYLKAGDFAKAEAEADKSLKAWKHDPLALWVLGNAQLGAGHLGQGEATMSEARDLWQGDWESITVDAI